IVDHGTWPPSELHVLLPPTSRPQPPHIAKDTNRKNAPSAALTCVSAVIARGAAPRRARKTAPTTSAVRFTTAVNAAAPNSGVARRRHAASPHRTVPSHDTGESLRQSRRRGELRA